MKKIDDVQLSSIEETIYATTLAEQFAKRDLHSPPEQAKKGRYYAQARERASWAVEAAENAVRWYREMQS